MTARKAAPFKVVGNSGTTRKPRTPKPSPEVKTVSAATESGTRRDLLVAMRARIATAIDSPATPARDLAALTRRLLDIAKEIDSLDAAERRDAVGDAAATPDAEWSAT